MRKYTANGNEVEVIGPTPDGGFAVMDVFERDSDEGWGQRRGLGCLGEVRRVSKLFDNPPKERLDKQVAELNEAIRKLHEKRRALENEVAIAEASFKTRMKKFSQWEQTDRLEDYVDGKITHFAVLREWDEPFVQPFKEAMESNDSFFRGDIKLLVLFGDSKGNLKWRINGYKDGSGSYREVVPCSSEAEATAACRGFIESKLVATEDKPQCRFVEWADKFSVPVPDIYRDAVKANKAESLNNNIKVAQTTLDSYKRQLEELLAVHPEKPVDAGGGIV